MTQCSSSPAITAKSFKSAEAKTVCNGSRLPDWQLRFLELLPGIRQYAYPRLRHLGPEARTEALAEVTAASFVAYKRLAEAGREEVAYAASLARYAVAQQRAGRRVGSRLNVRDALSEWCHHRKGIVVQRLDHTGEASDWEALVVEDRRAGPAAVVAAKLDFRAWLSTLGPRNRQVAELLATGESTRCAAR